MERELQTQETFLTLFTESSGPSPPTGTGAAHVVTQRVVVTLTPMATTETKGTRRTL